MTRSRPSSEYAAFTKLVDDILAVPRVDLQRRLAKYREQVDANPNRRGPKRKVKPSAADPGER